jgi:hypothetical protein
MDTFNELYIYHIEESLYIYGDNITSRFIDYDNVSYIIELEFNEERGIEVELTVDKDVILNEKMAFYLLVIDSIICNYDSFEDYCNVYHHDMNSLDVFNEYSKYKINSNKLLHLIGENLFYKFLHCDIDWDDDENKN